MVTLSYHNFTFPTELLVGCDIGSSTRTISNQVDVTAIADCTVFTGSIAIATAVPDNLNLHGVQEALGDLSARGIVKLTSLASNSIRRINGDFTISNAQILSALQFSELTAVGTIKFSTLPALDQLTFSSGISSVDSVTVGNTFLSTLDGISTSNVDSLDIHNNNSFQNLTLPLETAKNNITIASNGRDSEVYLSHLTSAGSIILREVSSIAIPVLKDLSGQLLIQGSSATNITADSLKVVTRDIYMHDNSELISLSFQALFSVRSIDIANNSELNSFGFGQLAEAGNINITGDFRRFIYFHPKLHMKLTDFHSISMPALKFVNETFSILSIDDFFNCSTFDNEALSAVKGNFTCQDTHWERGASTSSAVSSTSSMITPTTSRTTPTTSISPLKLTSSTLEASPRLNPRLSEGGKAGIIIGSVVIAMLCH
jgi:hypothetical protein